MARADDVSYLRAVKEAASAGVLPGKGKEFVEHYITRYENSEIALNVAVCNIKQYLPTMESIGFSNSLSITSEVLCANPIDSTSTDCSVIQRTTDSYNDCITGSVGSYQFYGESGSGKFGDKVATGDFNGDGTQDLAVGAEEASSGVVYVFYGGKSFSGKDLSDSETASATFSGVAADDFFGASVSSGDLNGDGVDDLIVGASLNDEGGGTNAGAVYVFYGGASFASKDLSVPGVTASASFYGEVSEDEFGVSVASGDLNADGVADLIVGALPDTGGNFGLGIVDKGAVYVFYGGASFTGKDLSDSETASESFYGAALEDGFGASVSSGDLNGDGVADLIVGASGNDDAANAVDTGAVYVFYGGASFAGKDLSDSEVASATFYGAAADSFGISVASGDLNGDGVVDLIVGALLNDDAANVNNAGAVYVFYGGASFAGKDLSDSETANVNFYGAAENDRFGISVASGDLNKDGVVDLVVGAYYNDDAANVNNAGAVYVFYGGTSFASKDLSNSETASATFYGAGSNDLFGSSVASGDLNADGFADIIIGAQSNDDAANVNGAGAVYVVLGEFTLTSIDFSV